MLKLPEVAEYNFSNTIDFQNIAFQQCKHMFLLLKTH